LEGGLVPVVTSVAADGGSRVALDTTGKTISPRKANRINPLSSIFFIKFCWNF